MSAGAPSVRRDVLGRVVVGGVAATCLTILLVAAGLHLSERSPGFDIGKDLQVLDNGLSEQARAEGVRVGDRLLTIDGLAVRTALQARRALNSLVIGSTATIELQRGERRVEVAMPIRFKSPQPVLVSSNLVALAFLSVGTVVGWQRPQHRAARLFFLATSAIGLYYGVAHVWWPGLVFVQAAVLGLAPGLTLSFFLAFPREWPVARGPWRFGLYLPGLIFSVLIAYAFYQALEAQLGTFNAPRYYYWVNITFGYLILAAAFGLVSLGHVYITSRDAVARRQIQWIVWGLMVAVAGGIVDMLLTALKLQTTLLTAVVSLTAIPLPVAFALAILRYGLMDVTLVIKRSVVYALLTAGLVAVYLLLVSGLSTALGLAAGGPHQALVLFISALLIGLLATPLRSRIQAVIDRAFFRRQLNYQRAMAQWSEELNTSLLFSDLAHLLLEQVPEEMAIERAWLLVLNQDETRLQPLLEPADGLGLAVMARSPFIRRMETAARVVLLQGQREQEADARGDQAPAAWRQAGVQIALPLVSGGQLLGLYLLGGKRSGDLYQRQELELLRTVGNQAAVAMSNARLYEQVRAFSQGLEKKVEDRTRELRDSLSVVYHELRTPITAIQGYVDMVANGRAGPVTERQARFLAIVRTNVKQLADLVTDLSEVSQITSGRLHVYPEPMDLRAAAEDSLATLAGVIEEKALKVEVHAEIAAAAVYGDYKRVVQIMTNLIGNACRYTPVGGEIRIVFGHVDGCVQATVQDTGIGIRPEEMSRVFERFYRSDDPLVREQRGTGLGLAITKSLVELQGGQVWVNSEIGKGSVFGFTLPAARAEPVGPRVAAGAASE